MATDPKWAANIVVARVSRIQALASLLERELSVRAKVWLRPATDSCGLSRQRPKTGAKKR